MQIQMKGNAELSLNQDRLSGMNVRLQKLKRPFVPTQPFQGHAQINSHSSCALQSQQGQTLQAADGTKTQTVCVVVKFGTDTDTTRTSQG